MSETDAKCVCGHCYQAHHPNGTECVLDDKQVKGEQCPCVRYRPKTEPTPKPTDGPPSEAGRAATDEEIEQFACGAWDSRARCIHCLSTPCDDTCPTEVWPRIKARIEAETAARQKAEAEIVRLREENAHIKHEMRRCHDVCGGVIDRGEKTIAALVEALEEDASGRTVPQLLRLAGALLLKQGGGPVEDCLNILADRIEAALNAAKEGGK